MYDTEKWYMTAATTDIVLALKAEGCIVRRIRDMTMYCGYAERPPPKIYKLREQITERSLSLNPVVLRSSSGALKNKLPSPARQPNSLLEIFSICGLRE